MYGRIIDINRTLLAVCNAISSAEATLKEHIRLYYHDANEEFITSMLHGHIKHRLREASEKNIIQNAFLEDLKSALPHHAIPDWNLNRELHWKAKGLIADIVLHNKRQEGKTGGDFGLVIVHPRIHVGSNSLVIEKGRISGLLCQAKLKDKNRKWRRLGPKQKAILPDYLPFASLVLYSYLDKERTDLNPVAWKLCQGKALPEIDTLLQEDDFGELLTTREVIMLLGREKIGTGNQNYINTVISPAPSTRQYFEIKIYWPKDNDPKGKTSIAVQQRHTIHEKIYAKQ